MNGTAPNLCRTFTKERMKDEIAALLRSRYDAEYRIHDSS